VKPLVRHCAIYTRKSTEEGLDQDFNTLDAQREACLAYITSQKSEGWIAMKEAYDDGGFTGGNIDRPALQKLLADIKASKIHIVVVYKIDRLTRSLMDFSKLVEIFDRHQVTFVSVTQSFNTTTSMGRLTLNVLLSFAQFEREVIAERTRDKIAASKKKGMWMGGTPPLGYDVINRQLVVNRSEADTVRYIFDRYLADRCVRKLQVDLKSGGIKSKGWVSRKGFVHKSCDFTRGALYYLLGNPVYAGMVRHGRAHYPGLHEAIIPKDIWGKAQKSLELQAAAPRGSSPISQRNLLTGKVFDSDGRPYTPVYTSKKGKRYRYYLNQHINNDPHHLKKELARLPAHEIETLIGKALRDEQTDAHKLAGMLQVDIEEHYKALQQIEQQSMGIDQLEPLRNVRRVVIEAAHISVEIAVDEFRDWLVERFKVSLPESLAGSVIKLQVPFNTRRSNKGAWVIQPENRSGSLLDLPPQELANLVRGLVWRDEYFAGTPVQEIAKREGMDQSRVHRLIRRTLEIA
jgi:site-specific DNA recombinase